MKSTCAPSTLSCSILLDEIPRENCCGVLDLHQWEGFWYAMPNLVAVITAKSYFEALDDDIVLATSMKTGTTWLKALIPCIMSLKTHAVSDDDDDDDPLVTKHPSALMPSLKVQIFRETSNPELLSLMPSPRLFRTHMPYAMLSDSIKNSGCKIVYITWDPRDTFVSLWHFMNTMKTPKHGLCPINEAFESFCKGVHPFGPFHDHVLRYWKESFRRPEKILFMKYEEIKRDPSNEVKKLASFLGRPFAKEEELDKVLWQCRLERLKNLEVNKSGIV